MTVKAYTSVSSFFDDNLSFLLEEEATNNLIIGLSSGFKNKTDLAGKLVLLAVLEKQQPKLVCLQTPPRNLILYAKEGEYQEAIQTLIAYLSQKNIPFPGVIAPLPLVTDFASQWSRLKNCSSKIVFEQMIYQLDELVSLDYPSGELIQAEIEHVALLTEWGHAFALEALNDDNREAARKNVEAKIKRGALYIWKDKDEVVSMAAAMRPTVNGITIAYVYTPPEFRGRGYASACVAHLSALMLKKYQFCSLYTDLSNPTSNKIYIRMGYQPIKESYLIEFE